MYPRFNKSSDAKIRQNFGTDISNTPISTSPYIGENLHTSSRYAREKERDGEERATGKVTFMPVTSRERYIPL